MLLVESQGPENELRIEIEQFGIATDCDPALLELALLQDPSEECEAVFALNSSTE